MADWQDSLSDLAHDLFNIEVNTIVARGITGRKMPSWPHALLDIASIYRRYLLGVVQLNLEPFEEPDADLAELSREPSTSNLDGGNGADPFVPKTDAITFSRLRHAAAWALHNPTRGAYPIDDDKREILFRIRRNSDQIKGMLEALAASPGGVNYGDVLGASRSQLSGQGAGGKPVTVPRLSSAYLVQIRKMWDIGTDRIVLQTVVQLDGDVINRVKPGFDNPETPLWRAHQKMVDFGTNQWKSIFELLAKLVGSAFKALFSR